MSAVSETAPPAIPSLPVVVIVPIVVRLAARIVTAPPCVRMVSPEFMLKLASPVAVGVGPDGK